jgi:hypothetical protein
MITVSMNVRNSVGFFQHMWFVDNREKKYTTTGIDGFIFKDDEEFAHSFSSIEEASVHLLAFFAFMASPHSTDYDFSSIKFHRTYVIDANKLWETYLND